MLLHERGRLALDDPLTKHVGPIARANVAAPAEVTIRRTLQNVAGFPVHTHWFFFDREPRPVSFTETLRCYALEINKPGARYVYSNIGYGVLGEVITRASGQPYETFLAREVLQPLGLTSAKIARVPEDAAAAATLHGTDGRPMPFILSDHPAASDLYISAEELARFGLFHAGGLQPSRPVIGEISRKTMQEPGLGGYGFGWTVYPDSNGRRLVFNSGAKPGASAALWIVPEERVAIALVANQIGAPVNQLAGEILRKVLAVESPTNAPVAAPAPVATPAAKPALPPPGVELRGQWRGAVSSCPHAVDFSLDIRDTHDLVAQLGRAPVQAAAAGAASRGEASGSLTGDTDMGPSTFEFDLALKNDRLEGPVVQRTNLGPRGNVTVTMWAVLRRPN
jgi:CubicO group peptidase (beta-lactamase class C family)